jgi:hypothetical protein
MLRLRRGVVVDDDPLTVEVSGKRRPAWADTSLLGEMRVGDEVVVNVAALDLRLGSGGFDVVHVNLTRGLDAEPAGEEHVMKLNYTSLQHPVDPIELPVRFSPAVRGQGAPERGTASSTVLVIPLHGHLAPAVWAAKQDEPELRVGYVQTAGGALPGALSRDVAELRERELLAGHVTAAPTYGGEGEALSVPGAIDAAAHSLGWDAIVVGPGPGIIGSETELGHGGMAALDSAHASLALGHRTMISPRLSSGDPRERHRPVSHHTLTLLRMLLAPVEIVVPAGNPVVTATLADASAWRHRLHEGPADLAGYAASGLPAETMGRTLEDDPLFFAAALAAGAALRDKG